LNDDGAETFNKVSSELALLGRILLEAAKLHGDNWREIEPYIRSRLSELSYAQRCGVADALERILRFRAPAGGRSLN
jgi:hypothetical protein